MINYYLRAFHAENFRQFSKISMTFGKNFNFITGPNGCGKSGILTGIHH
ncbi:AAA family ATPase, partial [Acinetobacter baumannii]|nr:AAA family ATPase [Acinetobacter baumannii]